MIDSETGYNDDITCTCKECSECGGSGRELPYETTRFGPVDFDYEDFPLCDRCGGSGKDYGHCDVHSGMVWSEDANGFVQEVTA